MNKSTISTILTCVGAIGVVATAVLTAKAVPKASALIEEARYDKFDSKKEWGLTKFETVKAAAPAYIPAIITGASTIACIFGANVLNKQAQASLASAYALLDQSYREYTRKVKEMYGEDVDYRIKEEIAKYSYDDQPLIVPKDEQLFYDLNSMQYFMASLEDVIQKTITDDGLECYIISTPFDVMPRF